MTKYEAALHDYLIVQSQIAEGANVLDYELLTHHLDTAIDALEKACDYRWHDLRKNPDDLPGHSDVVITYDENRLVYGAARYNPDDETWEWGYELCRDFFVPTTVTAWKEMEEFESYERI